MPSNIPPPLGAAESLRDVSRVGSPADADDLLRLVRRIARKDRDAFAALYDLVSTTLLDEVRSAMGNPADAAAVTADTFVEVWWLARYHTGSNTDVYAWMTNIVARRMWDRREPWWSAVAASYDLETRIVLAGIMHPRPT
jgi:DNA-directed RNA polymerase specialized sigma24 family protein